MPKFLTRWWHKRQYRKWEFLWLESVGRMEDVMQGVDGITYRIARLDQCRAETMMRHHADKGGLPHAISSGDGGLDG